jgi:hypothetical protein
MGLSVVVLPVVVWPVVWLVVVWPDVLLPDKAALVLLMRFDIMDGW